MTGTEIELYLCCYSPMKVRGFDDTIAWYNQNAKQYAKDQRWNSGFRSD